MRKNVSVCMCESVYVCERVRVNVCVCIQVFKEARRWLPCGCHQHDVDSGS